MRERCHTRRRRLLALPSSFVDGMVADTKAMSRHAGSGAAAGDSSYGTAR